MQISKYGSKSRLMLGLGSEKSMTFLPAVRSSSRPLRGWGTGGRAGGRSQSLKHFLDKITRRYLGLDGLFLPVRSSPTPYKGYKDGRTISSGIWLDLLD